MQTIFINSMIVYLSVQGSSLSLFYTDTSSPDNPLLEHLLTSKPHFIDEETNSQKGYVTSSKSSSSEETEPGFEPERSVSRTVCGHLVSLISP